MSSHVLAEVQHCADRVAIVRDGRLAALERVESLGRPAVRSVEIHFDDPVNAAEFSALPGVSDVVVSGPVLKCTVDGRLDPLIKAAARHQVIDLLSTEPDLEETFLSFYYHAEHQTEGAGDAAALTRRTWRDDRRAVLGWAIGVAAFTTIYTALHTGWHPAHLLALAAVTAIAGVILFDCRDVGV